VVICGKFASNCFDFNTVHPLRLQNAEFAPVLYFFNTFLSPGRCDLGPLFAAKVPSCQALAGDVELILNISQHRTFHSQRRTFALHSLSTLADYDFLLKSEFSLGFMRTRKTDLSAKQERSSIRQGQLIF
jgi:hypothetical protein